MCGFVAGNLFSAESAAQALDLISHRGKDASNLVFYPEEELWFGHRRLAIQDTSAAGDQPMNTGDVSLVYNGELWRRMMDLYPDYRSDTKLLADLYSACGGDAVGWAAGLDGMFAVVIYDRRRQFLVAARDRVGRIPLYYVLDDRGIALASEAKSLAVPLGSTFCGNGGRDQANSEVRLFPPGHVLVYDLQSGKHIAAPFGALGGDGDCLEDLNKSDAGAGYYAAGIRERLEAAVVNESISDVPVCTILSGGVDSTIVTAILARHIPDLRAYTVSVGEGNGKDDLAHARLAAEAIGVPLTEVILDRNDVFNGLEDAVWAVEDHRWVQVASSVPQIALARKIGEDGCKVVFGGEGSDELFGSYADVRRWNWMPEQYYRRRLQLCRNLHNNNIIRGNKAMMWGGTVELRTPFLDRELVDFCLRIPVRYRADDDGRGRVMKPLLREAFHGWFPEKLLMRGKVTFQEGAHSDFLKSWKEVMRNMMFEMFGRRSRVNRRAPAVVGL